MTPVETIERIDRAEAPTLARDEYDRFLTVLRELEPSDWSAPTDCTEWNVQQIVAHVLGAAESCGSLREQRRQMRAGKELVRQGLPPVDGIGAVQVRDRSDLSPEELIARFEHAAPRAVRGRRRTPGFVRRIEAGDPGIGQLSIGWLVDVIYTRDTWMHRIDICRAVGHRLELTPEHDGRIVADVVANWAGLHGEPAELSLTGPAGGDFRQGTGGPRLSLDAVEFCRTVSGREPASGLLATRVLF